MLWKNLAILIGLAWVTTTFAAGKIAAETMDDALGHKIERSGSKSQKRGVANDDGNYDEAAGASDPQYWNWENLETQLPKSEGFDPSVEDESEY